MENNDKFLSQDLLESYKQWGKQYVRFNVNLKNQDTNNSSFSYGDNRFEKSQGSNWTFQE